MLQGIVPKNEKRFGILLLGMYGLVVTGRDIDLEKHVKQH